MPATAGVPANGRLPERGLGLALEILEQVARHQDGVSAAELARLVGAPRATVYRVVNALVRDEYLVRRPDLRGFLLGSRVVELAAVVGAHREPAHRSILRDTRIATGEAVHLVAFHRHGLSIVDEDSRRPISDRSTFLRDPTRSAIGHLWLVERPQRPAAPEAYRWAAEPSGADVSTIAASTTARGYAEQIGLLGRDGGCLAVPIRTASDATVGAITLSAPLQRLSLAARHLAVLRDAAARLASCEALTVPTWP